MTEWSEFTDDVVLCRGGRHAYDEFRIEDHPKGRAIVGTCIRCGRVYGNVINGRGNIVARVGSYPEGYLAERGSGRMDLSKGRLEMVRRIGGINRPKKRKG